jgi:hypothetical protein
MPGYLDRLRRLPRQHRRQWIEEALQQRLVTIDDQPQVGSLLARMPCDGFRLTHLTYDEPMIDREQAEVQFTYHLRDGSDGIDAFDGNEIRGSGLARFDDEGVVHLSDVDGELFFLPRDDPRV